MIDFIVGTLAAIGLLNCIGLAAFLLVAWMETRR
jgi:hypothetical protein